MSGYDRQGRGPVRRSPPPSRYPLGRGLTAWRGVILATPATSRALSMNSFAVGLSIRFFRVVTATGWTEGGSPQGNILSTLGVAPKRSTEAGTMARKRPVARRLVRTLRE